MKTKFIKTSVGGERKETDMTVNISRKHLYTAIALLVVLLALLVLLIVHLTKPAPPNPPSPEASEGEISSGPPASTPLPLPYMKLTDRERAAYKRLVKKRILAASKKELVSYFGHDNAKSAGVYTTSVVFYAVAKMRLDRDYAFDLYMKGVISEEETRTPLTCTDVPGTIRIIERFAPELIYHEEQMKALPSWYGE